jgi:hypothetical protein
MMVGNVNGINTLIVGGITDAVDQAIFEIDYINNGSGGEVAAQGFIITNAIAGEEIDLSQLLFLSSSNKWFRAKADTVDSSTPLLGIATSGAGEDEVISVLLEGHYSVTTEFPYHEELTTATIGAPVYVSAALTGYITETAPTSSGEVVRVIGHNLYYEQVAGRATTDTVVVRFKPDNTWIEL